MERVNLLCEIDNCGKIAMSFGMKDNQKTRSCGEHIASLIEKRMQVFDILGYEFIMTLQDAVVFEERKSIVEKGRGNLTVLDANCEMELAAALDAIERMKENVVKSVEIRFEEMKLAVNMTFDEAKNQLFQLKVDFEEFLSKKENKLSTIAKLVCSELSATPKLVSFGVADASNRISAALDDSWAISSADIHSSLKCLNATLKHEAIEHALNEAVSQAQKGIIDNLIYVDSLAGDGISYDKSKELVITELLKFEKRSIECNLKWLKRTWDWRQRYMLSDEITVEVGKRLASILSSQHGKFSEAEQILRTCYDFVHMDSPLSEECMSLSNAICGNYFDCAKYEQAERLGVWMLDNFGTVNLPAEHYWTTLLYLTFSQRLQSKNEEANSILEGWRKRDFKGESTLAEMLRLLASGIGVYFDGRRQEAERLVLQAKRIGTSHFPTSPFTAFTLFSLTFLDEGKAREKYHRQAHFIYEVVAPKSIHAADNLNNFGTLLKESNRLTEAEECYKQAQSIYKITAPNCIDAAENLSDLGALLSDMKRWNEAKECLQQVQAIYEVAAPNSVDAAKNLNSLGNVYKQNKRWSEAEECYRKAQSLFEAIAPKSVDAAKNLYNLGNFFKEIARWDEAEGCYRQAKFIYEAVAPKSIDAANNLGNLCILLKQSKRLLEAEEYYRQAQNIYQFADCKSIDAAKHFYNLAILLDDMKRWNEAEDCYQQAQGIYEVVAPKSIEAAKNLNNLGILLKQTRRWSESEACYREVQSIYEAVAPKSVELAHTFYNMGLLFEAMQQTAQAIESFEKAIPIYGEVDDGASKSDAEKSIERLKKSAS